MATTSKGIYYPNNYESVADIPGDMKKLAESADGAIGESEYDDTDIKNRISNINTKIKQIDSKNKKQDSAIEENANKLERLKNNQIEDTTELATTIEIQDSANMEAKIDMQGNTEQKENVSLSTPQELKCLTGTCKIKVSNKNFVGGALIKGLYSADGNLGYVNNNRYRCFKATLPAGTYSVSYNADIKIVKNLNITTGTDISKTKFTLTEESTITYGFRKKDNTEWNLGETLADIQFQIERSETVTNYEKHQENTADLPLVNLKLYGINSVRDTFEKIDNIWYKKENIFIKELDGTENWLKSSNEEINSYGISNSYFDNISSLTASDTMCSHAKYSEEQLIDSTYTLIENYMYFNTNEYTTIDEFKAFLVQEKANNKAVTVILKKTQAEYVEVSEELAKMLDKLQEFVLFKRI